MLLFALGYAALAAVVCVFSYLRWGFMAFLAALCMFAGVAQLLSWLIAT